MMERINTLDTGKRFINDVLTKINEQNSKIGLDQEEISLITRWAGLSGDPAFLGAGSKGKAYLFGDRVLKITSDISEAKAAALISGEEHPNVYRIDKVGRTPAGKFAIVYEFLDYPNQSMVKAAEIMWGRVSFAGENKEKYYAWNPRTLSRARQLTENLIRELRERPEVLGKSHEGWGSIRPKIEKVAERMGWSEQDKMDFSEFWLLDYGLSERKSLDTPGNVVLHATEVLKNPIADYYNQLATGLTWLKQHGIQFNDLKTSNIMEKNNQIAVIDIGYSTVEGRPEIPLIGA